MQMWKKTGAAAAAVLLAAGLGAAGAAWAGNDTNGQPPPSGATTASPKIVTTVQKDDSYVPIVPCRVVDTRSAAAGKLEVGGARAIRVRGSGSTFASQGGKSGGCGIPTGATAVTATVTAVDAGSGFLRIWPSDVSQPNATFMNYDSAFNVSNSGTTTLCGTTSAMCTSDLLVRAYGSATHLVIDVTGYYRPSMWANVTSGGALVSASRLTAVSKLGTGAYQVTFDRDISACAYTATIDNFDGNTGSGEISVDPRVGEPNAVYLQTRNDAGANANEPFYLSVTC